MKQTIMAVAAAWALTAGAAFGQGAIQMQVVNATTEKVQVSIEKPVGGGWDWQFINGRGHFEPVPLAQGLGDRLVSVRVITAGGAVVLPSKVLAMSKFDPASATQPVLKVIFVSGIAGYDIVYTTGTQAEAVGTPVVVKGLMKGKGELSDDQKKAVEETLKMPATKGAGS
jgi:hypothetical protein